MFPLSIRLSEPNQKFMEQYLLGHPTNKNALVNQALDLFRKYNLKRELSALAKSEGEEDRVLAEAGMSDYLALIDE